MAEGVSRYCERKKNMVRSGLWIPVWMESLKLTHSQRMLYAEIVALHKTGGCFASNAHFAKVLGLKSDTITRMISKLRKDGFLKQVSFDGRKRTLAPLVFDSNFATLPEHVPSQTRIPIQSRVGESSKREPDLKQVSCTLKVQSIKQNKSWEGFKDFVKRNFSKSTFDQVTSVLSPEMLTGNLKLYYMNYSK